MDAFGTARVRLGINPDGFAWTLDPGPEFCTPEAILVYSDAGLGALSDAYHALYRDRLARGVWRDAPRPVVINNWEATYFDFDEQKLLAIASSADELGIELFVLDDGWFGQRDDDTSSLGDWTVESGQAAGRPRGAGPQDRGARAPLRHLDRAGDGQPAEPASSPSTPTGRSASRRGRGRRAATSSCSTCPGRRSSSTSSARCRDLLGRAPISYVKWDMNRNITEPFGATLPAERQGEFFHRYMLGVYELYERLTRALPAGSCSSPAPAAAAASTRACSPSRRRPGPATTPTPSSACKIQWGTSLCLSGQLHGGPRVGRAESPGRPDHAARDPGGGRLLRGARLRAGPDALTPDERAPRSPSRSPTTRSAASCSSAAASCGCGARSTGDGNETAWMTVSADRQRAVVGHYRVLNRPNPGPSRLRLRGLDPSASYRVSVWPAGRGRGRGGQRGRPRRRRADADRPAGEPRGSRPTRSRQGDFTARLFDLKPCSDRAPTDGIPTLGQARADRLDRLPMHSVPHLDRVELDGRWRFQLLHTPGGRAGVPAGGRSTSRAAGRCRAPSTCRTTPTSRCPSRATRRSRRTTNPTGVYERDFDLPAGWLAGPAHRAARRRRGERADRRSVNGQEVGVSKDSHLAAEFDVTGLVKAGANTLRLEVVKWSDATLRRGPGPVVARRHHPLGVPLRHAASPSRRSSASTPAWPTT